MSLNQVSQSNTQLPPEGIINGTFKSLNVNGIPIGAGGSGDLQTAYDNGDGVINLSDPGKPFSLQGTNGGLELTYGSARGTIESINNNIRQQLDIYGTDINHYGTTKVQCDDFSFLSLKPANQGLIEQALVSDGSGGVAFTSLKLFQLTFAATGVTGSRWLIPNGNALTAAGTAQTFATRFYAPFSMSCRNIGFSREVSGNPITEVKFYDITNPATPIYTYQFPPNVGAQIANFPPLNLSGGSEYVAIASDSVGGATVVANLTFTID